MQGEEVFTTLLEQVAPELVEKYKHALTQGLTGKAIVSALSPREHLRG